VLAGSSGRRAGPLGQAARDVVEDAALHIDALGAQADLAGVGEHRAGQPVQRGAEVGVVEDHGGVLAAQLERHRAHPRRDRRHDVRAGGRRAGERDAVDARVLDQELAGRTGPEAVHHVVDAGRRAGRGDHLGQQGGGGRGLLARLDHDRVAARQRGRDLPGQQQQRQVPRDDHGDHAERAAVGVVERLPPVRQVGQERLLPGGGDHVGERPEVGHRAGDVQAAGLGLGLAGVGALGGHEVLEAGLDAVRDGP